MRHAGNALRESPPVLYGLRFIAQNLRLVPSSGKKQPNVWRFVMMAYTKRRRETVTNGGDGKPPFRPRRTRTRYAPFGRVFRGGGDSQFEKRLARLAVLYEDLRVEVSAAALDPGVLPDLEPFGANYRQFYFMRRAIATANEFRQA